MAQTETIEHVEREARERLYPSLSNPSYLVLCRRRLNFESWLKTLGKARLRVLDVGGRIQPYRPLIDAGQYVAVDIQDSPLVTLRASAVELPFAANTFDLVLCTQVLEYIANPAQAVREIHRVLKPEGTALFSLAALQPTVGEEEYWRFTGTGVQYLMKPFRRVEVVAEGSSISGFFRTCAVCLCMFARFPAARRVVAHTIVPLLNLSALALERISGTRNHQATANYSVRAQN